MHRERSIQLILSLYKSLGWLYPPGFRARFAAEQCQVFEQTVRESADSPARLLMHELGSLPGVLLRCHWAALPGGGWKTLLQWFSLLALFFVPVATSLESLDMSILTLVLYGLLGGLVVGLVAGIVMGFPRWSLPYVGFALMIVSLIIFNEGLSRAISRMLPRWDYSAISMVPRLAFTAMWGGVMHLPLVVMVLVLVIGLRLLPHGLVRRLPKAWRHTRRWSDVSFLMYGAAVFGILLTFEEYRYGLPYVAAAMLCMVAGVWGFLRSTSQNKAVAVLLAAVTLAYLFAFLGKFIIVPLQTWPGWFDTHPVGQERWYESLSALLHLGWLWVAILLPLGWRPLIEAGGQTRAKAV